MAKIYLSYQHQDIELIKKIGEDLKSRGHSIIMDETIMKVGVDWRKELLNELKSSDGLLVLITKNSLNSKYVISEIGTTRAFIDENENKKFLIPVIYGDIEIPDFIKDLYCIRLSDDNYEESINRIDSSISSFIGKKEAVEEKASEKREFIERKAADYINIATDALKKRENQNKAVAYLCYGIGFITLVAGIFFAVNGLKSISEVTETIEVTPNIVWITIITLLLKSVIIIGLLLACSKYTFTLGKSFMHEALRNADRLHAISFGEFFIKAYGDKISSYNEINEIFQNWNIDKSSSFYELNSDSYDPKFSENLIDIIKSLTEKIKTK
ncbi:toll/interleukin-1 receptor domain-containing protein [Winogradskyella psychrotolerans]|uniref:toll/interleukin-1 receptor domain-containing protein n=1 Tax=Winogradskyella psychrotolerans TaxID=1344585 RepID=UPI001C077A7E|nr:toll/interleukin-1 receptor domain-containing protein [Winogradskyella psychrotolerans]MBU2920043.1 toll/interleukin-1 receptor domain-containing protein [Winogradskyella psychrotolerans]